MPSDGIDEYLVVQLQGYDNDAKFIHITAIFISLTSIVKLTN